MVIYSEVEWQVTGCVELVGVAIYFSKDICFSQESRVFICSLFPSEIYMFNSSQSMIISDISS